MSSNEELSVDQKRALFEAYEASRTKAVKASAALDASVKNIAEQIGFGPFKWQGAELSIQKRGERLLMKNKTQNVEEIG